jgi:hypothetical protein
LAERERENSCDLIRLHPSGLLEDLKHDWLATPIVQLFDAITEVASIDLSDDAAVGNGLRSATHRLVSQADAVSELLEFMDRFEPSIVDTMVRPAGVAGLLLTRALVDWMTSETDEGSADRGNTFAMPPPKTFAMSE